MSNFPKFPNYNDFQNKNQNFFLADDNNFQFCINNLPHNIFYFSISWADDEKKRCCLGWPLCACGRNLAHCVL